MPLSKMNTAAHRENKQAMDMVPPSRGKATIIQPVLDLAIRFRLQLMQDARQYGHSPEALDVTEG
jgi:hypothetical protein